MTTEATRTGSLIFSPSPHVHSGEKTSWVMYSFVVALVPAMAVGIAMYGMDSVRVIAVAAASAMAFEWVIQKLFRMRVTVQDGSALFTGLLLAMLLPPSVPWWLVVVGTFSAILVGKQIFGGLGGNPFCPALVGWAILRLSWNHHLNFDFSMISYDIGFSAHYPLTMLKSSGAAAASAFPMEDLLLGRQIGGIGATPVLALLLGGVFLIVRGAVNWRIPLSFLAGVLLTGLAFWMTDSSAYANPVFHIVTGNVMLGAFFLASDYSSSPVNRVAMVLFGLGCGFFTVLFRAWSIYPDGVVFAILLMNVLNPLLDRLRPKVRARV